MPYGFGFVNKNIVTLYIKQQSTEEIQDGCPPLLIKCPPLLQRRGGHEWGLQAINLSAGDSLWLAPCLAAYCYLGNAIKQKINYVVSWINV